MKIACCLFLLFSHVSGSLKVPTTRVPLTTRIGIPNDSLEKAISTSNQKIIEKNEIVPVVRSSQPSKAKDITKFTFYMTLWYFFTVIYNISNKNALNSFPLPATVSTLQLIIGLPLFLPLWIRKCPSIPRSEFISFFLMSLTHTLGIFTSVVALKAGSVSFAHVVKSAEPVFAALFSKLLLQQSFSIPTYLSLIPIIGGVALSSMTDFTFSLRSFIPAMLSNVFHQLRIILSKKIMLKSSSSSSSSTPLSNSTSSSLVRMSPSEMFQMLTVFSVFQLLPVALLLEGKKLSSAWKVLEQSPLASSSTGGMIQKLASNNIFNKLLSSNEGIKQFSLNMLISGISFSIYNEVILFVCLCCLSVCSL